MSQDDVKVYHAIIWPKPDTPIHEYTTALLRMDLHFAVGDRAPVTDPRAVVEGTLRDLHISDVMDIVSLEEVEFDLDSLYTNPE